MDEICVSASDFRVHLKDLAFLRKHRPGVDAAARERAGIPRVLKHPEYMPFEEVERLYRATNDAPDVDIEQWRGKAALHIWLTTGKQPEVPPYSAFRRQSRVRTTDPRGEPIPPGDC